MLGKISVVNGYELLNKTATLGSKLTSRDGDSTAVMSLN
jgi:hypothetical protein